MKGIAGIGLLLLLNGITLFGQDIDSTASRPTIFVYNFDDSPYTLDVGGGIGVDNVGLAGVFKANLDVYHIMAGFNYTRTFHSIGNVANKYLIFGYRYRTLKYMLAFGSGFGRQKFKCTSGMNSDCYNYPEETVNTIPFDFQADLILTDFVAVGVNFNYLVSDRQDMRSLMFCLKLGILRNVY